MSAWPQTPPTDPKPEPVKTSITVIENIKAEAPASIRILNATEISQSPGVDLDDRLRSVPGFTLFRRSSGITANPTTQGVSLRGLGSTGASRTLVLWDGVPINDPFGGWVYWTRITPEEISEVEISRGASTSVFGDRAMGGSMSLFSTPLESRHYFFGMEGGNTGQVSPSAGYQDRFGNFGIGGTIRAFRTDGYYIVPSTIRGLADSKANVEFVAPDVRMDYTHGANHMGLKFDMLAEDRANGTVLTNNSTSLGTLSANYSHQWANDVISLNSYYQRQQFHASFSSISADRNTERITMNQSVPAEGFGGSGIWRHSSTVWNLIGGADYNRSSGTSNDYLIPSGVRTGGGIIFERGVFVQGDVKWRDLRLFAGMREQITDLNYNFFSPSFGFAYGHKQWRARGSVYRAFRAPTLNELYREFRAGNTVTQANPGLVPETTFGSEVGGDWNGEKTRLSVTGYRNSLNGLITNVTLSSAGGQIVRQRRNAVDALTRGVEVDLRRRFGQFEGTFSYLFADSRYVTGERIPQVARQQGSAFVSWHGKRTLATFGLRASGLQFEDDRNTQLLPGFATLQFTVSQHLTSALSANAAVENLADRFYLTGWTPAAQSGPPRLFRVGLRWQR